MKKDLTIIFLLTIPFLYIIEQLINYKELRRNHDVYHHDMVDIKREFFGALLNILHVLIKMHLK